MYCAQSFTTVPLCHSSQLFGEDDPDEDVSPDTADPELTGTDKYKLVLQYSLIFLIFFFIDFFFGLGEQVLIPLM